MTTQDLAGTAQRVLSYLPGLARKADLREIWQATLSFLMEGSHASGAALNLGAPCVLYEEIGELTPATRAILQAAVIEADSPAPETLTVVRRLADQTLLSVVILSEHGWAEGCLTLAFTEDRRFAGHDCERLGVAIQAVAALGRNAQSLRQTEDRLSRFRHLYEVGQAIASTLDLNEVLQQSTERMTEVLRAEASTLMLVDESRQELVFTIPAGPAERLLREHRMPMNRGVAGWVATHGQPIIIADVTQDARFFTGVDQLSGFRTRSIMAVPLQVKGKTIGVAEVINKRSGGVFTTDDQQWLSILAPLIATAVENARLFAALRDEHDRIIAAEEKVRHELARDLHDGPAQILAAMILNIDMARRQIGKSPEKLGIKLDYLESLAQEANHEVRNLLFSLRPLVLETHGLTAALAQLVERLRQRASYQISLDVAALADEAIEPSMASTLFVIVQEALNNIHKHAQAQQVIIRLGARGGNLWVEIEDDGVGFDIQKVEGDYSERGSFGLLNIRERARLIEGSAEFISPLPRGGHGTQVRVEAPLNRGG